MVGKQGRHSRSNKPRLLRTLMGACGPGEEVSQAPVDVLTRLRSSGALCAPPEALAEGAIELSMPSGLAHRLAA